MTTQSGKHIFHRQPEELHSDASSFSRLDLRSGRRNADESSEAQAVSLKVN